MLADLDFAQLGPTRLWSDNQAAIRLVRNPEFHRRTKHIDVKFHIIREAYATRHIALDYISTNDQVADLLTKPLPRDRFERLPSLLGMTSSVDT